MIGEMLVNPCLLFRAALMKWTFSMGWKYIFSLQPYGQRWRDSRRMFWQEFHPEHGRAHHRPIQLRCSRDLIRRLYESPIDFQAHVRQ